MITIAAAVAAADVGQCVEIVVVVVDRCVSREYSYCLLVGGVCSIMCWFIFGWCDSMIICLMIMKR